MSVQPAIELYDIQILPDRYVFTGPEGDTSEITFEEIMTAFWEGMVPEDVPNPFIDESGL